MTPKQTEKPRASENIFDKDFIAIENAILGDPENWVQEQLLQVLLHTKDK